MEDILEELKKELDRRQNKNSEYSIRAFARDLEVDQSLLTKILNGKRRISPALRKQFQKKIR